MNTKSEVKTVVEDYRGEDEEIVTIESCDIYVSNKLVTLTVDGHSVNVHASELIKAINNCTNV